MIVFDIDGTILPGTSCERLFVRYLIKNKILRLPQFLDFCYRGLTLIPRGLPFITKANKGYLRNFRPDDIARIGSVFFENEVAERISAKAIDRIKEHQERGERIILFSGMPDFLLRNFSEYLHVPENYGSIMEIRTGRFTGRTLEPFPLAEGKIKALEMIIAGKYSAKALGVKNNSEPGAVSNCDWSQITFYGDHWLDRYLMHKVGHPVAVNPKEKLRTLATEKGWPVEEFGLG